jgi:hypothetical protein
MKLKSKESSCNFQEKKKKEEISLAINYTTSQPIPRHTAPRRREHGGHLVGAFCLIH